MPSLPKLSTGGVALLPHLLPLFFLLILDCADVLGASLREHRLRGSEPDPQRGPPYLSPNADMLKALEYIESLHQQARAAPQEQNPLTPDYDTGVDEKQRTMLRLASPAQSQSQAGQGQDEQEEVEEEEEEGNEEDKTQEWLQAVLSTLEQSEKTPDPAPARQRLTGKSQRPAKGVEEERQEGGGAYPSPRQQHGSRAHRMYPPMFEDAEGERDEERRGADSESQFKRTNENVEEKYTPQNLATLQSVFEELGRLANGKAGHKRQANAEDDDDEEEENGADMFGVRTPDYDDVIGGEDWTPMEQIGTEEEERDPDLENDEEEYDDNDDDEDEEEENYQVKRSTQPGPGEDPDDITKLVDYYLLKVLEKTEEEQKRELEEEEEKSQRRSAARSQNGDIDPQALYQFIRISQKLQIPPEDLLDMLKTGETTKPDRTPQRNLAQTWMSGNLPRMEDKLTQVSSHKKNPPEKVYRWLPETQTSDIPEDVNTEDVLNILRLERVRNPKVVPLKQDLHATAPSRFGRQGGYTLSRARLPETSKDDYDDNVDEDELATYLAAQILTQYPVAANNKADHKRESQPPPSKEQPVLGQFEQAIQDYFDQIDSDKGALQKRQAETEDVGGAALSQPLDDDALLNILSIFDPEAEESEDKDLNAKTVKGM